SPGQSGHLGRQGVDRQKSLQASQIAKGQVGQECAKDVNRPVRPKQETSAQGKLGQVGQMDAADAESPDRPKRRTFALTALGHLGQRYANQLVRPK
ncbi:hypothetical protein KI387_009617, partial [Taxus chinensis]